MKSLGFLLGTRSQEVVVGPEDYPLVFSTSAIKGIVTQ